MSEVSRSTQIHNKERVCINVYQHMKIFLNLFRTMEVIPAGSELSIHYEMDMEFAPEWYMVSGSHCSNIKVMVSLILNPNQKVLMKIRCQCLF